ncbi:restriction endonuclease [Niallia sp. 03091]|uniref:restriction endonuclease n=1 Tax=unclassified Niallia TaxID=2837522 RepID=UPI004044F85E
MKDKDKQTLGSFISLLIVIGLWFIRNSVISISPIFENAIIYLFGSIFIGIFIGIFIISFIPGQKKKASSKKKPFKKTNTSRKVSPATKTYKDSNKHALLHNDKEIITLPFEELTWRDFERLCYLYFEAKGYTPRETSEGADGGVDLIIYNKHHQADIAIQIKKYAKGNQITVKHIRELATAKKNHKCMLADFITTSSFTNAALREANKFNIKCYSKDWVENKILRWRDETSKKIS